MYGIDARNLIKTYNLCFLGFGNVNRTLAELLENRAQELRERYGIDYRITGVASRRLGWLADPNGINWKNDDWIEHGLNRAESSTLTTASFAAGVGKWLATAKADVLFEATSLDVGVIDRHPKLLGEGVHRRPNVIVRKPFQRLVFR